MTVLLSVTPLPPRQRNGVANMIAVVLSGIFKRSLIKPVVWVITLGLFLTSAGCCARKGSRFPG